jgi:cyclophilin family peptidyl-prolyl cis-trans isomerase
MKLILILIGIGVFAVVIFLAVGGSRQGTQLQSPDLGNQTSTMENQSSKKTYEAFPGVLGAGELEGRKARIETEKGVVVVELFGSEAPRATSNFIFLSREGFYNGLTFHRREEGFVIQGGDPNGNGTGGPGYQFEDEPVTKDYTRGIVAMANSGPNTNGSQFFIMLADRPLPKNYTIFGQVASGMDVVDKIQIGDRITKITIE